MFFLDVWSTLNVPFPFPLPFPFGVPGFLPPRGVRGLEDELRRACRPRDKGATMIEFVENKACFVEDQS